MNMKTLTGAFIIGLLYEVLLHICTLFFNIEAIYRITHLISILFGLVILAFIMEFYKKEKSNKNLKRILEILIGLFIVHLILSLPIAGNMSDLKIVRLSENTVRFIISILLFVLLVNITKIIKGDHKTFHRAAALLAYMLGIVIFVKLYSFISYLRFFISGAADNPSSLILNGIFVLFLLTRLSMILFLYRYYKNGFMLRN